MEHLAHPLYISEQDYLQTIADFSEAFTVDVPPTFFHAALIGQISTALAEGIELSCTERSAISRGIQKGRARQKAERPTDTIPRQTGQLQAEPIL